MLYIYVDKKPGAFAIFIPEAPEKIEFAKACKAAEDELRGAIAAFKKSFA